MDNIEPIGSVTEARVSAELSSRGIKITRKVIGYPYAKCGNHHNPTAEVVFSVFHEGRMIGRDGRLRGAKELAHEYLATPPSER